MEILRNTLKKLCAPTLMLAIAMSVAIVVPSVADASNYYLTDLGRFEKNQIESIAAQGIETTEQFLAAALTERQRKALSTSLSMSEPDVMDFARDCELMQISGVGPKAARLLRAAGVVSIGGLSQSQGGDLLAKIKTVNKEKRITQKDPSLNIVQYWIAQAAKVPFKIK